MADFRNHHRGHTLYVSPTKRRCAECGCVKDVSCFASHDGGRSLRTVCTGCQRDVDAERSVVSANNAFKRAVTAMTRPVQAGRDDAPAARKIFKGIVDNLHRMSGREDELNGEQVFARMFADFCNSAWTGNASDFTKLKAFQLVLKLSDSLLRHDQQKLDLSGFDEDELAFLLRDAAEKFFKDHPKQQLRLLKELFGRDAVVAMLDDDGSEPERIKHDGPLEGELIDAEGELVGAN